MPAVPPGSKVLLTSGNGFIGTWVANELLKQGYSVRTTVRAPEKGDYLKKIFADKYPEEKFEYVIAEDLEKPGVFDEPVKGVAAVLHTGSPFHYATGGDAYKTLINPAVNGTKSVLSAIQEHGKDVKRVILTSSYAAVMNPTDTPRTFTVDDWNTHSPAELERLGSELDGKIAYRASKTLAERAAWAFIEEQKPSFDLVTVCPPFVLGPFFHEVHGGASKLNTSSASANEVFSGQRSTEGLDAAAGNCVDVRDVAAVHVLALGKAEAGGQRLPASYGGFTWQDWADRIQDSQQVPENIKQRAVKGNYGAGKDVQHTIFDGSKSEKLFGFKHRSLQDMVDGMAASLADYDARDWKGYPSGKLLDL